MPFLKEWIMGNKMDPIMKDEVEEDVVQAILRPETIRAKIKQSLADENIWRDDDEVVEETPRVIVKHQFDPLTIKITKDDIIDDNVDKLAQDLKSQIDVSKEGKKNEKN